MRVAWEIDMYANIVTRFGLLALAAAVLLAGGCARNSSSSTPSGGGSQLALASTTSSSSNKSSSESLQPTNRGTILSARNIPKVQSHLKGIGNIYQLSILGDSPPPRTAADLKDLDAEGRKWIEDGYYTIYYGVNLSSLSTPSSTTILAFENAETAGRRYALFVDGHVAMVSRAEFDAAPKAKAGK
jgi:prepilin-type processing-associated H-X9-DG protein